MPFGPMIATREPAFGLEALWISEADRERAQLQRYSVVDPATVIVTHISELTRRHAHELLGRQEVQTLLDELAKTHPKAVEELVPQQLTLGQVQKVLQNLLREGVSVRDLLTVVETLADHAPRTKDADELTEYARHALARTISRRFLTPEGSLPLVTLSPQTERVALQAVQQGPDGGFLALEPALAQSLVKRVGGWAERFVAKGQQPVVLCSAGLRPYLRRLLERYLPTVAVLSAAEIPAEVRVQSLGMVALDEA